MQAVTYGSLVLKSSLDTQNSIDRLVRTNDGLFSSRYKSVYSDVSGLIITNVYNSNLKFAKHWFCYNPHSTRDINYGMFDLSHYSVIDSVLKFENKKAISEILFPT